MQMARTNIGNLFGAGAHASEAARSPKLCAKNCAHRQLCALVTAFAGNSLRPSNCVRPFERTEEAQNAHRRGTEEAQNTHRKRRFGGRAQFAGAHSAHCADSSSASSSRSSTDAASRRSFTHCCKAKATATDALWEPQSAPEALRR